MAQTVKITPALGTLEFIGNTSLAASTSAIFTGDTAGSISLAFPASQGIQITGFLTVVGNITATTFIKSGGTAAQFLKADGSVDATSYVPASRTLTINGVSYDLTANRSWTISTSDGYISNVQLTGNELRFTGEGNAFTGTIDLSSIIPTEADTLDSVTDRGSITPNAIDVGGVKSDYFLLDILADPTQETGMVYWNDRDDTANLRLSDGVDLRLGQDQHWYVKAANDIAKGQIVMAAGTDATSGHILVSQMIADGSVEERYVLGIATKNIATGEFGHVVAFGKVYKLNLSLFQPGDVLFCDPNDPGQLTNVEPTAPQLAIPIAFVVNNHHQNGVLAVRVLPGYHLGELHDVNIVNAATGQLLRYNGSAWANWTPNFATPADISAAIAALVDSAPTTLDTLNELAAALGDDPNFVTTITNSIATKLPLAGGTMTGNINFGATDLGITWNMNTDAAYIKFFNTGDGDTNSRLEYSTADNGNEYHRWMISSSEEMTLKSDGLRVTDSIWMGGNLVATQSWVGAQGYHQDLEWDSVNKNLSISNGNTVTLEGLATEEFVTSQGYLTSYTETDTLQSVTSRGSTTTTGASFGGNVGIGTSSPSAKLDVSSNGGRLRLTQNTAGSTFNGIDFVSYVGGVYGGLVGNQSTGEIRLNALASYFPTFYSSGAEVMRISTAGNVGIGTTAPLYKLHVSNPNNFSALFDRGIKDGSVSGYSHYYSAGNAHILGMALILEGSLTLSPAAPDATSSTYRFINTTNKLSLAEVVAGNTLNGNIIVFDGPNVGIGTTAPSYKLDVTGTARITSGLTSTGTNYLGINYLASNASIDSTGDPNIHKLSNDLIINAGVSPQSIYMYTNSTPVVSIKNDGNVGIGTTTPTQKLEVQGAIRVQDGAGNANKIFIGNIVNRVDELLLLTTDGSNNAKIQLSAHSNTLTLSGDNLDSGGRIELLGRNVGNLVRFHTAGAERMRIDSAGNIGIGTTAPATKLEVNGTIRVSGSDGIELNRYTTYGDNSGGGLSIYNKGTSRALRILATSNNGWGDILLNPYGANVGIGTTNPATTLDVNGVITATDGNSTNWNAAYADKINSAAFNTTDGILTLTQQDGGTVTVDLDGRYLTSETDSQELSWLPETKELSISGGNSVILDGLATEEFVTSQGYLTSYTETDTLQSVTSRGSTTTTGASFGGNVGIGTTSPDALLHISGASATNLAHFRGPSASIKFYTNSTSGYTTLFNMDDTGLDIGHDSTARALNLKTGTVNRLTILGGGNVGIGTTAPSANLEVAKGGEGLYLKVGGDNATNGRALEFSSSSYNGSVGALHTINATSGNGAISLNTAGVSRLFLDRLGNVGIGATDPLRKLHVVGNFAVNAGTGQYYGVNITGGEGTNPNILIGDWHNASANLTWDSTNRLLRIDAQYSTAGAPIVFSGNDAALEYARFTATGNFGIGTSSPARALHVVSTQWDNITGGGAIFENNNTVGSGITLKPTASVVTNGSNGWAIYAGGPSAAISDGNLGFWAHGTNEARLVIQRGGNVGIGTTSPSNKLTVEDTIGIKRAGVAAVSTIQQTGTGLILNAPSGYHPLVIQHNGSEFFRFTNSGNLGIGTSSPEYKLDVLTNDTSIENTIGFRNRVISTPSATKSNATYGAQFETTIAGANSNGNALAFQAQIRVTGTNTNNVARGFLGRVSTSGAGNAATAAGGQFFLEHESSGVITNAYGLQVLNLTNLGRITNTYGVYVGDITVGTQTNTPFSFYAADSNAHNYFAGNVGIGTTSPSEKLQVNGNILAPVAVAKISLGPQSSTGDAHFGSSGLGNPEIGSQDYGFYAAHNAYRTSTGAWKHSRNSTIPAVRYIGSGGVSTGTSGFHWDYSNNVGDEDIIWTSLMQLDTNANLNVTGVITAAGGNSTNWNTAFGWGNHASFEYATESYVDDSISALVDSSPDLLNTLNELAAALGDDPDFATTVADNLSTKAPLASPALTGTPTAPTAATSTNTTQIATTAFVKAQGYLTSYTETDTLATVTGRGATTSTAVTFNSNVTLGNNADLIFRDISGIFPTTGKGFDWTLNNDGARIYAIQPSTDTIDLVFQLRDNATTNDRFVFWVQEWQGPAYDKYPLIIRGGTEFDLVDSGLFVRGTQVITNGRVLQNITGNISMFTNNSGYGLSTADITAVGLTASTLTLTRAAGNLTASVPTFNQNTTGSAATLTTARTFTIGNTGKTFNGSANVAWTLAEIGAQAAGSYAAASHTHDAAEIVSGVFVQELIPDLSETYSVVGHTHAISEITGLQTALNAKAPLASPALTGTPTAPTAATSTNTTQIATTAFVKAQGYSTTTGTVTSVSGDGGYGGLTLTGTVTSSGSLTLGGTPTGTWPISVSGNATTATTAGRLTVNPNDNFSGTYPILWHANDVVYSSSWMTVSGADDRLFVPNITASGNITAATFTGALSGNATTATTLATARTITLSGAVTGSANFDGSANITITTTATPDPTLTLAGDATGSATFTNLGNATLTVAIVDDSHTHDGRYYTETESDARFVNVTGDTVSGDLIVSSAALSVISTTAGSDAFYVDGVNGRLFTVTDSLDDSLFSVNTISGLPVIEAFADNTVKLGPFANPVIIDSTGVLSIGGAAAATQTYVNTAISNLIGGAPGALDTLNELAAAINDDASFASSVTSSLALKAPLASPALTGTPTAPTAATSTNTTQIATTAFVKAQGYITSYTETDTLATVTGRGATTSTALTLNGNVSVGTSAKLSFGSQTRQMIDLWSTSYGIGVQSSTQYFRTGGGFAWFRGGIHSDAENNPGSGGVVAMRMDSSSNLTVTGNITSANFSGSSSGTNTGDQTTITGNAGSATVLQTARTFTIGATGKTFNGSANVAWTLAEIGAQAAGSYAAASHTHDAAEIVSGVFVQELIPDLSGTYSVVGHTHAATDITSGTLAAARLSGNYAINVTGSAATLTTARTLTIGNTGKTFNGSANVSWSLAEIGAASSSHTHNVWDLAVNRTLINIDTTGSDNFWQYIHSVQTTDGTHPGSYTYIASFGDRSQGIQFSHGFGNSADSLFFRAGTDNPASENGAGVYTTWRQIASRPWVTSQNYITASASITGNAATATTLQTARTLTIGNTGKTFNGGANVAWTLAEIGAYAATNPSGYITSSGNTSGYSGTLLAEDNRTISPNELTAVRLKFGFTSWANNNTAPYADFLHMRSYADSSGGNDNLVMFLKSGIGMRIYQQTFGSGTAYSTFKDVAFTDSNITGNAATATILQTARTLTIGNTGKTFNGGANVAWTLAEIGAQAAGSYAATSHTHTIADVTGLQGALDAKAPLASPALTGTPTAPTAAAGTNTTQIATTSYVDTAVSKLVASAPDALDTLNELAAALGEDPNFATTVTNSISGKVSKSGDTMTGALTLSYAYPRINLTDTNHNSDYSIINDDGIFSIYDVTNNSHRLRISAAGDVTLVGTIAASNFSGTSSGTNTGDQTTITGNAGSATILQTIRTINGTNFNGSANITTSTWGTARTITIGNTGKSVNGGANVAWTLAEIGAAATAHTHDQYIDKDVQTLTGPAFSIAPADVGTGSIGLPEQYFREVHTQALFTYGHYESGLKTPNIGSLQTGTVVVWKNGKLQPCTKFGDHMVMGVIANGSDSPIVMGAELVLVTGPVNEGDYLLTSDKTGHAIAMSRAEVISEGLIDTAFAKALESGDGDSYTVKAMINKL